MTSLGERYPDSATPLSHSDLRLNSTCPLFLVFVRPFPRL
jgi:hypothetical protein